MPVTPMDTKAGQPAAKVYRGPYSVLTCPHCTGKLEAGPAKLASWCWCIICQSPVHRKHPCKDRCPRSPFWDSSKHQDWVLEMLEG